MASRSETGKVTSAADDKAGARGRHGARTAAKERVYDRHENPVGESYGVGVEGEGREAYCVGTETF